MRARRKSHRARRPNRRRLARWAVCCLAFGGLGWLGWTWWTKLPFKPGPQSQPVNMLPASSPVQPAASSRRETESAPRSANGPGRVSAPAGASKPVPVHPTNAPGPAPGLRLPVRAEPPTLPRGWHIVAAQIALAQRALSPGSIDGVLGYQTRSALRAFQQQAGLAVTGELDQATRERLTLTGPLFLSYEVTSNDLARLQPLARTWLGKSLQERLDYETILELVAEKSQAHPDLIRQLNPQIDWNRVEPGTVVQVPNSQRPAPAEKAAFVEIDLTARTLQAFGSDGSLLAHFPCSIARNVDKRPVGELQVVRIVPDPDYTFDPDIFPESAEGRQLGRKLRLPPGPNNPVGTVWIGLDRPGYGIHGTPHPEQVGRTESHGCFRLANWNAEHLLRLAWVGMPVRVRP